MTRADVTARFGEPERTEALTKSDESIWGPVESFWSEVPMGSDIEIWAFRSSRNGRPGQTELYFVDHADAVGGIGFYDEGAVYESRP